MAHSTLTRKCEASKKASGSLRAGEGAKFIFWEARDMSESGAGGYLVPGGFRERLATAMKAYDRLFDVATPWEATGGGPSVLPFLDDTGATALVVAEGVVSNAGPDPVAGAAQLGICPTYRSGLVKVSHELLQDSSFPVINFLTQSFGVRFARGVGAALVTTLLSAAKLGATAAGATVVTIDDLYSLMGSLDSAYLPGDRTFFVMNWSTVIALWKIKDTAGHPIIPPVFNEQGYPVAMGFPICVSPSWPGISTGSKCIGFGNLSYFILRSVPQKTTLQPFTERFAEFGQVAFESRFRADGALLCGSGADAPFKYLKNA